jgi:hypothetical protein
MQSLLLREVHYWRDVRLRHLQNDPHSVKRIRVHSVTSHPWVRHWCDNVLPGQCYHTPQHTPSHAAEWESRGPWYTCHCSGNLKQSKPGCFLNCKHNTCLLWNNKYEYYSWSYDKLCVHLNCSLGTASNDIYIAQHKPPHKCSDNSLTQATANSFQILPALPALLHMTWSSRRHTYLALCSLCLLWASVC